MRIPVEGIPAAGRRVDFSLREDWAANAASESLEQRPDALEGHLLLTIASKRQGLVRVDTTFKVDSAAECDRCSEPCLLHLEETMSLLYAPEEAGGDVFDGGEIELEADDLDVGWYTDGHIVATDVLREALTLAQPSRIVCTDTVECDKRTQALLAAQSAGVGHPAFGVLADFDPSGSDKTN
ncbi:MAG: YceD family protein [Myxococcota bacterium]